MTLCNVHVLHANGSLDKDQIKSLGMPHVVQATTRSWQTARMIRYVVT